MCLYRASDWRLLQYKLEHFGAIDVSERNLLRWECQHCGCDVPRKAFLSVFEFGVADVQSGAYPNGYSMHDLGTHFPNATKHVEGNDEYMPVEESGNMILMTYAYYKYDGPISTVS